MRILLVVIGIVIIYAIVFAVIVTTSVDTLDRIDSVIELLEEEDE